MNIREATIADLPAILALYAQPSLDDGQTLGIVQAENIFRTMQTYPYYKIFVADREGQWSGPSPCSSWRISVTWAHLRA